MTPQQERGLRIVRRGGQITESKHGWIVRSEFSNVRYLVRPDKPPHCTCPDYELRQQPCKHFYAVKYRLNEGTIPEQTVSIRPRYPQNWPVYNAAQTQEKPWFIKLLHDLCETVKQPEQRKGRPRLLLADMVFAAVYKVYVGSCSRRFTGDLEEAWRKGIIQKVPHFNSVTNYLSNPELASVFSRLVTFSSLPLKYVEEDFATDSSGFSTCRFVQWYNKKYGRVTDNREWVKAHLVCGVRTQIVVSAEISGWFANDSPYFVPLLKRAAEYFRIQNVLADKAYLSHQNLEFVEELGGMPYIPFKTNTVEPRDNSIWGRMYHRFMSDREGFLRHYHQRSNVETCFSMIKGKFGDSVRSKSYNGQANEVLCKIICHNLCVVIQAMFELGIQPDFCAEWPRVEAVGGGSSS